MHKVINFKPLVAAGTLLGLGMGGFFDGILLHQILQVHNMLSAKKFPDTLVNAEINMFWDGLFHAFTWTVILIGITYLWKTTARADVPRSSKALIGSMIFGWGTFNLVEGIIDHHILQVHHVVERASQPIQLYWDLAFLASGILMIIIGQFMISHAKKEFQVSDLKSSPSNQWQMAR